MTFNKTFAYSILLAFPLIANATEPHKKPQEPKSNATATSQSVSSSAAQSASNSASEASNSLNVEDRRQAPAVLAPSIAPTAPCYYSVGGGLSVPGFGASGGKAIKDEACELRENIRLAYSVGLTREADYLFCSTIGKDIPSCGAKEPTKDPVCEEKVERVLEACTAK